MYTWCKRWSKNHCSVLVGHPCVVEHIDDLPVVPITRPNVWSFKPRHFFSKTKHSKCFKYKKLTNEDQFLNKTDICPVLNASKVSHSEVETSLLFKGLNFCPTLHEVVKNTKQSIPEHFPKA